jgi:hypothetical protein
VIPSSDPSARSPRERLNAFLKHVRLKQTLAPVMRYARDRSTPKLVRLLDSTALQGNTRIARDLLATCVRWNPCGLYGCLFWLDRHRESPSSGYPRIARTQSI